MNLKLVARMLSYLGRVRATAILAAAVITGRVMIEVLAVYFLSPMVTAVCKGFSSVSGNIPGFLNWVFSADQTAVELRGIFILMLASQGMLGLMMYLRSVWEAKLSMRVVFHIRKDVYDHLQRVGFSFHDKMSSGQLISRALSDLQSVRNFVNTTLFCALDVGLTVAAYLALLCFRSPALMLGALIPIPFCVFLIMRFNKKSRPVYREQQEAMEGVTRALTENVYGVHTIRACGMAKSELSKYKKLEKKLIHRLQGTVRLQAALVPTFKGTTTATHVALFVLAAFLISRGKISVGDIVIIGSAMAIIMAKLQQLNQVIEAYQKGIVSAQRLFEVLDAPRERSHSLASHSAKPSTDAFMANDGEIVFDGVTFGYNPAKPVLRNLSATIPGKKVTAITGPTGSGKSTLVNLVGRFYDPESGEVRIDGTSTKSIDPHQIRKHVGYVFQETFLFTGSVRDNIRYGRIDVSEEMLRAAARAARAEEFIETLPRGYDTLIGEGGVMLSGGQRQRIALARALVYNPRILILDDATAALDAKTERAVRENVRALFSGRTVLMVAHKKAAIQAADHVLSLTEGAVR